MSKELEALERLYKFTTQWKEFYAKKKDYDLIKQVLKRNEPMKVKQSDKEKWDFNSFHCPNCDFDVWYGDEKHNYCFNCGQKLNWRTK